MVMFKELFLTAALIGACMGLPQAFDASDVKDESTFGRIARELELQKLAMKAHQRRAESGGTAGLKCFGCKNSDNSQNCLASIVTCQEGEVCATVWHSDNTNYDGCLSRTLCDMLANTSIQYSACCDSDLCNMLRK